MAVDQARQDVVLQVDDADLLVPRRGVACGGDTILYR